MKSSSGHLILGIAILAAAGLIAVLQRARPDSGYHEVKQTKELAPGSRGKDRVQGTPAERLERLRLVFLEKKSQEISPEDIKLMRSLPGEALMGLLDELGAGSSTDYPDSLVSEMIKRLGEIEETSALAWLSKHDGNWLSKTPRNYLKQLVLLGWAQRDPHAALAKTLDPDFYGDFAPWQPGQKDVIAPPPHGMVAKAAADDPEGTWELLRQHRRKELGSQFFENLDPALAKSYALRLTELFRDPSRPGLEVFGGIENDPVETATADSQLAAAKQAAGGWFVIEPDAALAWYLKQSPLLENNGSELGEKAGELISRWVTCEPAKAMGWARSKPAGVRGGMACELAGSITARRAYSEDDMSRLNEAFTWMDETQRLEWLIRTAKNQRWHVANTGVETSPAEQIVAELKMTPGESAALAKVLAAQAAAR